MALDDTKRLPTSLINFTYATNTETKQGEKNIEYTADKENLRGTKGIGRDAQQSIPDGEEAKRAKRVDAENTSLFLYWHHFLEHCHPDDTEDTKAYTEQQSSTNNDK